VRWKEPGDRGGGYGTGSECASSGKEAIDTVGFCSALAGTSMASGMSGGAAVMVEPYEEESSDFTEISGDLTMPFFLLL
jgi:hypothetical protein